MKAKRKESPGAPPAPDLGPVLEFMRVVWGLDHSLQRVSKRMEATLGVTGPQRLVIRILGRFPSLNAGQLAGILHLHPSTLTGILKRLQSRGLITRRVDPRDRRRVVLGLTAKGRALDIAKEGTVEAVVSSAYDELSATKLRHAADVMTALVARLDGSLPAPEPKPRPRATLKALPGRSRKRRSQ